MFVNKIDEWNEQSNLVNHIVSTVFNCSLIVLHIAVIEILIGGNTNTGFTGYSDMTV